MRRKKLIPQTYKELADEIGMNKEHLSRILRGKLKTTHDLAIAIEKATKGQFKARDLMGWNRRVKRSLEGKNGQD